MGMNLIINSVQVHSLFNYGNQFARVQFAQLVNYNARMRNALSGCLVTPGLRLTVTPTYQSELQKELFGKKLQ